MITVKKAGTKFIITADTEIPVIPRTIYALQDIFIHLVDLWNYREFLRNLVIRDLKVRYRNSVLGILWSLFNPILMMIVFTTVFTIMTPYSDVRNFPVFVLCGILPWNFFATSVNGSIRSIVDSSSLVKKVYFPREILPISIVLANFINFLIALSVLFALLLAFRIPLTKWILLLPMVILVQLIFTMGFSLIMATANVFYRDTQIIMETLMLAWFFVTPVFYSGTILPRSYEIGGVSFDVFRWVNILNPMASIIANYRVIIYGVGQGGAPPDIYFFSRSLITSVIILIVGALIFYRNSLSFGEQV